MNVMDLEMYRNPSLGRVNYDAYVEVISKDADKPRGDYADWDELSDEWRVAFLFAAGAVLKHILPPHCVPIDGYSDGRVH